MKKTRYRLNEGNDLRECNNRQVSWKRQCLLNIKVEYHANENPLKNSEKNSISWSKVNVSNNQKNNNILPCYFFSNAITFLGFYIKNSSF